jgi:ABC-type Mn2+/Zn2+ transport system permease subunit
MTKPNRFTYFILIISVIILGILSRKTNGIPPFFGDILYAVMIYFGMRFLFINQSLRKSIVFALIFCFSIELLQLYRAEWILAIRRSTLGHYVLGEGFLWSDLVCYTIGVIIAFLIDWNWNKKTNTPTLF